MPRYGKQPFIRELGKQGFGYRAAAEAMNIPYTHLCNVAYGRTAPSPALRRRLPRLLERRLEDLFTEAALAAEFHADRTPLSSGLRES